MITLSFHKKKISGTVPAASNFQHKNLCILIYFYGNIVVTQKKNIFKPKIFIGSTKLSYLSKI